MTSAEQAGDDQRAQDLRIWDIVRSLHVQQHCGQHACGAAGRRGDDAVVGVLAPKRQRHRHTRAAARAPAGAHFPCSAHRGACLAHVQAARQRALGGQTVGNGLASSSARPPRESPRCQGPVQLYIFAQRDVAPKRQNCAISAKGIFGIDLILLPAAHPAPRCDVAAADGGHAHGGVGLAFAAGKEVHSVLGCGRCGVSLRRRRPPSARGGRALLCSTRSVPWPRPPSWTANRKARRGRSPHRDICSGKSGGALRPHGVGVGRPLADLINVVEIDFIRDPSIFL